MPLPTPAEPDVRPMFVPADSPVVAWLLRVGPIAARLNRDSLRDEGGR